MARREIGTRWDRENRNNINENFKELYDVQDRAIEEATQSIIDSAKLIWLEPVNTFADIATIYPNPEIGYTVFVRDTGKVYRFYNGSWMEIQQIDAGPVNEVDTRLSAEIEENRQEIEQARTKADGTTFPVLRDRLNDVDDKIGILNKKTQIVTPLEYGAVGDGVNDDTSAIQSCINDIIAKQTTYDLYNGSKVSTYIIDFAGKEYAVSAPITLPKCAGITFKNGIIRAKSNFVGDFVLKTIETTPLSYHYLTFQNIHLDGNFKTSGFLIDNYNRCFINNMKITGYTDFGLKIGDVPTGGGAHELIVDGLFIGQYEWNAPNFATATRTGIALVVNQSDNHFINFIIFDGLKGVEVNKEYNIFNSFHVWGCTDRDNAFVVNSVSPITINQGYFDGAALKIYNPWDLSVTNCFFLSNTGTHPTAYLIFDTKGGGTKWVRHLNITGNRFKNVDTGTTTEMLAIHQNDGTFDLGQTDNCFIQGNSANGNVNLAYSEYTKSTWASNESTRTIDFTNELKLCSSVRVIGSVYTDDSGKTPITSVTVSGKTVTHKLSSDVNGTAMNSNGTARITATINKR